MIFKHGRIKVKRFYCFLFIAALFVSCFCLFRAGIVVLYPACRKKKFLPVPAMEAALEVKVTAGQKLATVVQKRVMVPVMRMSFPPPPENPEMFYIIFDPNGGSGERIYEKRAKNTNYFSAYTSFFKTGYAFLGWTKKRILMKFFLGMEV